MMFYILFEKVSYIFMSFIQTLKFKSQQTNDFFDRNSEWWIADELENAKR